MLERRMSELQLTLKRTEITMSRQSESDGKRAYQKPELTQVSLKAEEAVLAVCKTQKISGAIQARCLTPAPCSSSGS